MAEETTLSISARLRMSTDTYGQISASMFMVSKNVLLLELFSTQYPSSESASFLCSNISLSRLVEVRDRSIFFVLKANIFRFLNTSLPNQLI